VRLVDLVDAISNSCDQPIKYSVEEYAVVFSRKTADAAQLFTRTFKVDPDTFWQGLMGVSIDTFGANFTRGSSGQGGAQGDGGIGGSGGGGRGLGIGDAGGSGAGSFRVSGMENVALVDFTQTVQDIVRAFFEAAGVSFVPPSRNTLFFNDRTGLLMVRATLQELDLIEQAIEVLNASPPQISIEAKFTEITQADTKALGFDWFVGNTLIGGGRMGAQPGTAPSFAGAPSPANPSGIFPGPAGVVPGSGTLTPGPGTQPPRITDNQLTSGIRNVFGAQGTDIPALGTFTGILTDPQFRVVIRAIEQRTGSDLLAAPRLVTLSGRQAQVQLTDLRSIVTGLNTGLQGAGGGGGAGVGGTLFGGYGLTFQDHYYIGLEVFGDISSADATDDTLFSPFVTSDTFANKVELRWSWGIASRVGVKINDNSLKIY
jgi:type II secretory pathway component GspD/PulD (secretin)